MKCFGSSRVRALQFFAWQRSNLWCGMRPEERREQSTREEDTQSRFGHSARRSRLSSGLPFDQHARQHPDTLSTNSRNMSEAADYPIAPLVFGPVKPGVGTSIDQLGYCTLMI